MVENVRFYGLKLQIAFSEAALYECSSIRTEFRLIEALKSLQIESRHLPRPLPDRGLAADQYFIFIFRETKKTLPPKNKPGKKRIAGSL